MLYVHTVLQLKQNHNINISTTLANIKIILLSYNNKGNKIPKVVNFAGEKHFKQHGIFYYLPSYIKVIYSKSLQFTIATETMAIGGCPFTLRKREEKSKHPTQGERQVSRKQRRKVDSKAGRTSFLPKPYHAQIWFLFS